MIQQRPSKATLRYLRANRIASEEKKGYPPDTPQHLNTATVPTEERHEKNLKAVDALKASPTSRTTHHSTPDASPIAKPAKTRPHFTDEIVILQHGFEADAETFHVHRCLLDNLTPLWRGETEERIILPQTHAIVFNMFLDFLNGQRDPLPYLPSHYSQEPWRSHAIDAWFFSDTLNSLKFEKFALSHFISSCPLLDSDVFLRIEEDTNEKSSLRRFSKHWVAWNHSFASDGTSEYAHLDAAKLAGIVTRDTNDPRIYDIDHWYSSCGDDINSSCNHDPIIRENAVQQFLDARKPVPELNSEWEQWEYDNQPGHSKKSSGTALASGEKKTPAATTSTLLPPPIYKLSKPSKSLHINAAAAALQPPAPSSSPPLKFKRRLQANAVAAALRSSASNSAPPLKPKNPHKSMPTLRPKQKTSVKFKSSNVALRDPTLRSTASVETTVPVPAPAAMPVTPIINPPRPSTPSPRLRGSESLRTLRNFYPPPSYGRAKPDNTTLQSSSITPTFPPRPQKYVIAPAQPQEPSTSTAPPKQLTPMARWLLAEEMPRPPKRHTRADASVRRAKSAVLPPVRE